MSFGDPIADFLTRIRNSVRAQHRFVDVNWSRMNQHLAEILHENGFIEKFLLNKETTYGTMRIFLKYGSGRQCAIQELKRISKPGLRRYVAKDDLRRVFGGMGMSILSTSQGVMIDKEAHKRKIGGELLCQVW